MGGEIMTRFFIKIVAIIYVLYSLSTYSMLYQTSRDRKKIEALIKQQLMQLKPHGLLFFLDESEAKGKIGAVTNDFLKALVDKPGPIIASVLLLKNIEISEKEKDPAYIYERYVQINREFQHKTLSHEQYGKELQKLAVASLASRIALDKDWIIKEITTDLYLLIPKNYITNKNITLQDVIAFIKEEKLTKTELKLGLKINHMKTVSTDMIKLSSYWREVWATELAHYFILALWNTKRDTSSIFITNKEYAQYNSIAPLWAFYISGHAALKRSMTGISINDFRTFLTFLEKRIKTNMLYYKSCYATGLKSGVIFEDSEQAVDKTYPFTIITDAVPDAKASRIEKITEKENKIEVITNNMYASFFKEVENSDVIDYRKIAFILTTEEDRKSLLVLPQVKLPGLEWFSVIDTEKTISIGRILASKRTNPLNIATFFAKKGKKAEPDSILLYATNVLFELVINTPKMPAFVSMIPGDAAHHFATISSSVHTVDTMINSFLQLSKLGVTKIFVIDTLNGQHSAIMEKILNISFFEKKQLTLKDITIMTAFDEENNKNTYKITFIFGDTLYEMHDLLTPTTSVNMQKK